MFEPPRASFLPDGRRLHLQHGPIDLIVEADGDEPNHHAALAAAVRRFQTILPELCEELLELRRPVVAADPYPRLRGRVARRMEHATAPYAMRCFITPMAAVAGAVADEILATMIAEAPLRRAYVNNGGDIALKLTGDGSFSIGLIDRPDGHAGLFGATKLGASDRVGGIATSGWRGRSFSFGIADSVTILAADAARADAAATIVANAVDLPDHKAITRVPACDIQADSDLGPRLVTRHVGPLSQSDIDLALDRGEREASVLVDSEFIAAAAIHCCGVTRLVQGAGTVLQPSSRKGLVHA